jgi:hypothetical protein
VLRRKRACDKLHLNFTAFKEHGARIFGQSLSSVPPLFVRRVSPSLSSVRSDLFIVPAQKAQSSVRSDILASLDNLMHPSVTAMSLLRSSPPLEKLGAINRSLLRNWEARRVQCERRPETAQRPRSGSRKLAPGRAGHERPPGVADKRRSLSLPAEGRQRSHAKNDFVKLGRRWTQTPVYATQKAPLFLWRIRNWVAWV